MMVCMARALAHGTTSVKAFSDPTALFLLPEEARASVEAYHAGVAPKTRRERIRRTILEKRATMMVARTVAIDDVVRAAAAPQVVILGAGLDGRAWRMPELRDVVVFEIDHPDTQRDKRARVPQLTQSAREVRFVPVDFTRDDLDASLAGAGHDPKRPTTWIWEGVVMYLTQQEAEASLAVIERRSCAGSQLTIAYTSPAPLRWVVGLLLRRIGEPIRSSFTADAMRALLGRYGFEVVKDEDVVTVARALALEVSGAARAMLHLRIVNAERR
jgi:methyltransferase (TIGR00027 family)